MSRAVCDEKNPTGWTGFSKPVGPKYTPAQMAAAGATPAMLSIIDREGKGYTKEWNSTDTGYGHAFGVGQLTGYYRDKYLGANWQSTDLKVQIGAMKRYITDRYGTDAKALAFKKKNGWY